MLAPLLGLGMRVDVENAEHIPERGPALLVCNRALGLVEPLALTVAVRVDAATPCADRRSSRTCRSSAISSTSSVGSARTTKTSRRCCAPGHLAAVPLSPTWLSRGVGTPPLGLLVAALGYPVIPVAVLAGGPLGLPIKPWRVIIGAPLDIDPVAGQFHAGDPLGAAELAEAARAGVRALMMQAE